MTQCTPTLFDFQDLGTREVVAAFDGGKVTSDGGGLLLREVEAKFGFIAQFAAASPIIAIPNSSSTASSSFSSNASSACVWAMKISTTTTNFATIRCWRFWSARKILWAKTAFALAIRARLWRARARSIAWNLLPSEPTATAATRKSSPTLMPCRASWSRPSCSST